MKHFGLDFNNKKIFSRKANLKFSENFSLRNSLSYSNINIFNTRKIKEIKVKKEIKEKKENKSNFPYKKIDIKNPKDLLYINLKTYKKIKDQRIADSVRHLKKIANLFNSRLANKNIEKNNNEKDIISESNILPRVISFNENSEIINKKSRSKSNDLNLNFNFNPQFPYIKKINIVEKSPRNIVINNNNYYIILKKRNQLKNIKNINSAGYKSIYLSFNLEKQKEPDIIQRFKNSLKRRYLQLKKPKNKRFYDFNSVKGLYKNKSDINILKNKNINNSKNSIENEEDLDTDLILNDKGTLINFNDVLNK